MLKVDLRLLLLAGLLCAVTLIANASDSTFEDSEHCLGYRAEKTMFFFNEVQILAKTCVLNLATKASTDGQSLKFSVSTPVNSLDSNSEDRDEAVMEILKASQHPNLEFHSEFLTVHQLRKAFKQGHLVIEGILKFGGHAKKVQFQTQLEKLNDSWVVHGNLDTSFTELDLDVPIVGPGGSVAKAKDYLKILFHLQLSQFDGLNELL